MYLFIVVEKVGVKGEVYGLYMKNDWDKWVERKKNWCFGNFC